MKRRLLKAIVVMILLNCLTVCMCTPAMAASYIKSIIIKVEDNGEAYPDIYVNDRKCWLTQDISWDKEEENLTVGTKVRGLLTLVPDGGYYFKQGTKIDVNFTGSGKESASSTYTIINEDECKLLVIYTVNGRPDTPEEAYWGESNPWIAYASQTSGATGYEFTLYKSGTMIAEKKTVAPHVDFSEELTEAGVCGRNDVYFEVRAARGNNKSRYTSSNYYCEWEQLKDLCDKVGNRTWKWSDSSETSKPNSSNGAVSYPGEVR